MRVIVGIKMLFVFLLVLPAVAYAQQELPIPVENALKYRRVPDQTLSVYVESLDTGAVVLAWNDAVPRNPASVEKMLTTLVALDTLKPAYTWKTDVHVLGEVKDGVLDVLVDETFKSCYRDRAKSQNDCQEHDCQQCAFVIHLYLLCFGPFISLYFLNREELKESSRNAEESEKGRSDGTKKSVVSLSVCV